MGEGESDTAFVFREVEGAGVSTVGGRRSREGGVCCKSAIAARA